MPEIRSVRWHHEAIVEMMLAEPNITQNEIAHRMGMTASWVSIIVNSDAFEEYRLAKKAELLDPALRATIEQRLSALAKRSLDKLLDRLDHNAPMKNSELIEMAKLGAAPVLDAPTNQQNNLYFIQAPPRASSTQSWVEMASEARRAVPQQVPSQSEIEDARLLPPRSAATG